MSEQASRRAEAQANLYRHARCLQAALERIPERTHLDYQALVTLLGEELVRLPPTKSMS